MSEPTHLDVAEAWAALHVELLRQLGEHWVASGEWMTVQQLGFAVLRREDRDVLDVLRELPAALGRIERPEERIELRVRALALVPNARPLLDEFVRVVMLVGQRLLGADGGLVLRSDDLTGLLGMAAETASRVAQLVFREYWMLGSGSGDAAGEWQRDIDERAVPVRSVTTLEEYLQVEGARFWSLPASRETTPAHPLIDAMAVAVGSGSGRGSLTAPDFHPQVAAAVTRLLADGHNNEAVAAAALALRDLIRARSGRHDLDGSALVDAALGGQKPAIALADLATQSGRGEQEGWWKLAAGCVAAIRNPVAHRRAFTDSASTFEAIATMSLLARRIDAAGDGLAP